MSTTPMSLAQFGQTIKAKYPQYSDMADEDVGTKVLAKYPQYQDMVQAPSAEPVPTGKISADNTPWLQKLEDDVRTGGTSTIPGQILKFMGASGTDTGTTPAVADKIASPILGPIHAAQGASQIPSQPLAGTAKMVGGILQAADLPLSFIAAAPGNAEAMMGRTIPSVAKEQAAAKFQQVMAAAKNNPVAVTDELSNALSRYQDLVSAGGSRSLAVSKLLNRVTDPEGAPLTYQEARDFYSNLTRLSADEMSRLTPVMRSQIAQVTGALGRTIGQAAADAGQRENYAQAMSQFRYGAQGQKVVNNAIKYGATVGGGGVLGGYLARAIADKLISGR